MKNEVDRSKPSTLLPGDASPIEHKAYSSGEILQTNIDFYHVVYAPCWFNIGEHWPLNSFFRRHTLRIELRIRFRSNPRECDRITSKPCRFWQKSMLFVWKIALWTSLSARKSQVIRSPLHSSELIGGANASYHLGSECGTFPRGGFIFSPLCPAYC